MLCMPKINPDSTKIGPMEIGAELKHKLRMEAARRHTSMHQVVIEALEKACENEENPRVG